jgi:hypothetical protein
MECELLYKNLEDFSLQNMHNSKLGLQHSQRGREDGKGKVV